VKKVITTAEHNRCGPLSARTAATPLLTFRTLGRRLRAALDAGSSSTASGLRPLMTIACAHCLEQRQPRPINEREAQGPDLSPAILYPATSEFDLEATCGVAPCAVGNTERTNVTGPSRRVSCRIPHNDSART